MSGGGPSGFLLDEPAVKGYNPWMPINSSIEKTNSNTQSVTISDKSKDIG
jgi:hypothetical protein